MGGCSCSDEPVARHLAAPEDFTRLARCCRRVVLSRGGRITIAVPGFSDEYRQQLETRINLLWQACGCAEGAAATLIALVLWFSGLHPFATWVATAGWAVSALACLAFVTAMATVVKFAAIVIAHQRLARLLDAEAARLSGQAPSGISALGQAQTTS